MLQYAIVFLVIALIAAFLGFGGIAGTAAWIAKVLFVLSDFGDHFVHQKTEITPLSIRFARVFAVAVVSAPPKHPRQ